MKLDKQQVPQLIVLGVLLVACVGYVSFQIRSTAPPPASVPAPVLAKTEVGTADIDKTAAVLVSENLQQEAGLIFPTLISPVPRRDPFQRVKMPLMPLMPVSGAATPVPAQPRPVRQAQNGRRNPFSNRTKVPQINVGPIVPTNSGTGMIVVPPPDPAFTLTGIVRGVNDVAIIRNGQTGRYVVKAGQLIEGRYRVRNISHDSITLEHNGHVIRLKLGGA